MTEPVGDRPPAPERADFNHWRSDILRFSDVDPLGHINNVAYVALFESGRVAFFADTGHPVTAQPMLMAVHLTVDYRSPLTFPGTVDIGTRVMRMGRRSMTIAAAVFDGNRCAATCECVMVTVDPDSGRAVPVPDALRSRLSSLGEVAALAPPGIAV